MADEKKPTQGKQETQSSQRAAPRVPEEAVGQVTVETRRPDGDTTVETRRAGDGRQATRSQRPTRQSAGQRADLRRQTQSAAQERLAERRAEREANLEERSVTLKLSANQWASFDRQVQRSGQDEAAWFRRHLAPLLR